MGVEIREATSEDFEELEKLGREMHEESSYSSLAFSPERLRQVFSLYLRDPNKIVLLGVVNGETCGLYAGYLTPYYFSNDLVANDIAWFVTKKRRGSSLGLRLLSAFESWALDRGASEVRIGYSTDINPSAFDSLMRKRGYSRVGGNYRLENSP